MQHRRRLRFLAFSCALALAAFPLALPVAAADYRIPVDTTAVSVTTSATQLLATQPAGMRELWIQPSNGAIYVGGSGVTTATGIEITQGQILMVDCTSGAAWYAVATSGTVTVHVLPIGGS